MFVSIPYRGGLINEIHPPSAARYRVEWHHPSVSTGCTIPARTVAGAKRAISKRLDGGK